MLTTDIQTLFNKFQEGFKTFNLAKVADCYHLPCTLNTPDKMTLLITKQELSSEINSIFEQLKNEKFVSVTLHNASYMKLIDELIFVNIDWTFIDSTGQVFSEFSAFYHLITVDKKLKIINAVSHQISNSQRLGTPFSLTIEHKH